MQTQIKKGLLDPYVLAIVKLEDTYGYKLLQDVSSAIEISESTLYPVLRRLETQNCLSTYHVEHNGRLRKYYKITAEGIVKLEEYKQEYFEVKKIIDFIINGGGNLVEQK